MNQIQIPPFTPVVKKIMIAAVVCWIGIQFILDRLLGYNISDFLILNPKQVIDKYFIWQTFTYMFFHALSPFHLFFNGLMLWFFGSELEKHWGSKFFSIYFFVCGIGAALVYTFGVAIYAVTSGNYTPLHIPVMGASGALFGLLVAYGIVFSDREIYFMGLFPMKAKYFAMLVAAMDLSSLITTGFSGTEVAYLAHLGGALVGFVFLWTRANMKLNPIGGGSNKLKKRANHLKVVVDNEKNDRAGSEPKYWN